MARHNRIDWPVEQMREWYEQDGLNCREIGLRLGRDPRLVQKVGKKHGFRMRSRGCSGDRNVWWRGGVSVTKNGYRYVRQPQHPHATARGYVAEHRLVMEEKLGRLLLPTEVVHHKNGNRGDNTPDNLMLYQNNGDHCRDHMKGKPAYHTEEGWKRIVAKATKHNWSDLQHRYEVLGWSMARIAQEVGCSASLVRYHVVRLALQKPKCDAASEQQNSDHC